MIRRRLRMVALAIVLGLAVGGCGDGDLGLVSDTASAELAPRAAEIHDLAAGGHPEFAAAKVAELQSVVEQLVESGQLSEEGAAAVLAAASAVATQLQLITTTTTATTVPPAPATTEPPPATDGRGHRPGHGHDRDRGD